MARLRTSYSRPFQDIGTSQIRREYLGSWAGYPDLWYSHREDHATAGGMCYRKEMHDSLSPLYPYVVDDHDMFQVTRILDPLRVDADVLIIQNSLYADYCHYRDYSHSVLDDANAVTEYFPENSSFVSEIADGGAQKQLDAISNFDPGDPEVDILNFLFEMRDFPGMLRGLGDILSRKATAANPSEQYLAYSFGWAPLIGDLQKLLNFAELVNKRYAYLQRLAEGAKISRTLEKETTTSEPMPLRAIVDFEFEGERIRTDRVWYTVHLKSDHFQNMTNDDLLAEAKRLAFSTRLSANTIWQSLPWSWLIDWFTNVGNYIAYFSNRHLYEWSRLNVMWQASQTITGNLVSARGSHVLLSGSGGYRATVEVKSRFSTSTLPSKAFAFSGVTNHQAAILGSLATSRRIRDLLS